MTWLKELVTNPFLITSCSSWFIAQLIKVIINFFVTKKLDWERLVGDGGMPSGHSATVSSLAVFAALRCGCGSFEFAVCAILAIIVCHDAMGVRQEAGKQARMLNEIIRILEAKELPQVKLKELVGHTPLQVIAGICLGVFGALCMYFLFFNPILPKIFG
jgi:acid phosphatase family membrane protein YuiD